MAPSVPAHGDAPFSVSRKSNRPVAFTLIELLAVIATLAILAGVAAATAEGREDQDAAAKARAESAHLSSGRCAVERLGTQWQLQSPAFVFTLDTHDGLRARSWKNQLTGRQFSLGLGSEVELDFDTAERRLWITGWKEEGDRRTTHVFLPLEAKGKPLALTLGGFGLYDYRHIQAGINGHNIGARHAPRRWHEPGVFNLGPGSLVYPHLRFGQDNLLEIRCQDPILRTERMEKLGVHLKLPRQQMWPVQFEQYLTIGRPLSTPPLQVTAVQNRARLDKGDIRVELESAERDVAVAVTYRWTAQAPVLQKFVEIRNTGGRDRRLMNVRLGSYATDAPVSEGEQGFPVYLNEECFMSVAHPSGWAMGQDSQVTLRQFPGTVLPAGAPFECMEVVLGTARKDEAREIFVDYVRRRCRRVVRGHDKPYAIYESFGGGLVENYMLTEKYVLEMLDKFGQSKDEAGYQFDICNTHFWVDYHGDLERFDPQRFPNGFKSIKAKLDSLGLLPGLWIDSSMASWSIGGNPVVQSAFTHDPAYEDGLFGVKTLCRATDPIRTLYTTAFQYHVREHGIRLVKFDDLMPICYNSNHPHLPGVYSTEAIHNGVIETLEGLDAECPDVFLLLYWGHRSPWWLLHGDTLFESGLDMEAATPGPLPTLYVRDGVTVRLDQGQWWREDLPALGKDTLGVWLSDWPWNSSIGKERWQEAFVMDICRGHLLAQIWTDNAWLSPEERQQLAEFIDLLKAAPGCFANPRFIVGNPWKNEPYGYSCADGQQAFLVLNNCTWSDVSLPLELNSKWGLPDHGQWDLYRWYPDPAQLRSQADAFGQSAPLSLRPFEVVLLEVVRSGQPPALNRRFDIQPIPARFAEASCPVELAATPIMHGALESTAGSPWIILDPVSATSAQGAGITKQADHSLRVSGRNATPETYTVTANTDGAGISAIRLEAIADPNLPGEGPGRAFNGNFALSELRLSAAPQNDPTRAQPVVLRNPVADFSQQLFGHWPVAAVIDGNPNTGWSIHPEQGWSHTAIFETREPCGFPEGTALTFILEQQGPPGHNLGRFRLSVTTAKPLPALAPSRKPEWLLSGQAPACAQDGILVISAALHRDGVPYLFNDAGARFACSGVLARQEVPCEPVVRGPGYPVSWQAWRIRLKPSPATRSFELRLSARVPESGKLSFAGHFVPIQ